MVPRSIFERSFVLIFFYCSHILAQVAIGNLILLVTEHDAAHTRYQDQVAKLDKYSKFRKLPNELKDRIRSYYEHQWKILNGFKEDELLKELPNNLRSAVRQATLTKYLKVVPIMSHLRVAVLNALAEVTTVFIYSPHDVIVSAGSQAKGVHIVLRGECFTQLTAVTGAGITLAGRVEESQHEVAGDGDESGESGSRRGRVGTGGGRLSRSGSGLSSDCESECSPDKPVSAPDNDADSKNNSRNMLYKSKPKPQPTVNIVQALGQGEAFGAIALQKKFTYAATLSSGAGVCEILFLSSSRFRHTCRQYMTDVEYRAVIGSGDQQAGDGSNGNRPLSRFSHKAAVLKTDPFSPSLNKVDPEPALGQSISGLLQSKLSRRRVVQHTPSGKHVKKGAVGKSIRVVDVNSSWQDEMFAPNSLFRQYWDAALFFFLFFYSLVTPLIIADTFDPISWHRNFPLFIIGWLVDLMFAVDLVCRCVFFAFYNESVLFSHSGDIWKHFLTIGSTRPMGTGWAKYNPLLWELAAVIPWEMIALGLTHGVRFIGILRLPKLLHLSRLGLYSSEFERCLEVGTFGFVLDLNFETVRFMYLYIGLFHLLHYAGCLWECAADVSTELFGMETNWKFADRSAYPYLSIAYGNDLHGPTAYKRAVYWAVNSMSTSGSCDMPSTNVVEMSFVCVALILGCQSVNALMGSIASLMANVNLGKRDFQRNMETVAKVMKFRSAPTELAISITNFYHYNHSRSLGSNEVELLSTLPVPLKEAVLKFIAGSVLIKIPFFQNCIEPMVEMLLGLLSHRLFLNGDDVVIAGEYGKEMFIIESGKVVVTSPDKKVVFVTLSVGSYIGESCLLKVTKRTASAQAKDYCETYVMHKEDFEKALEAFPKEKNAIVDGINAVLEAKAAQNRATMRKATSAPVPPKSVLQPTGGVLLAVSRSQKGPSSSLNGMKPLGKSSLCTLPAKESLEPTTPEPPTEPPRQSVPTPLIIDSKEVSPLPSPGPGGDTGALTGDAANGIGVKVGLGDSNPAEPNPAVISEVLPFSSLSTPSPSKQRGCLNVGSNGDAVGASAGVGSSSWDGLEKDPDMAPRISLNSLNTLVLPAVSSPGAVHMQNRKVSLDKPKLGPIVALSGVSSLAGAAPVAAPTAATTAAAATVAVVDCMDKEAMEVESQPKRPSEMGDVPVSPTATNATNGVDAVSPDSKDISSRSPDSGAGGGAVGGGSAPRPPPPTSPSPSLEVAGGSLNGAETTSNEPKTLSELLWNMAHRFVEAVKIPDYRRLWESLLFCILVYNLFMIPLRISFYVRPRAYVLDLLLDSVLWCDAYLRWTVFPRTIAGTVEREESRLREAYMEHNLMEDLFSLFPFELFLLLGLPFVGGNQQRLFSVWPYLRTPKWYLVTHGTDWLAQLEKQLEEGLRVNYVTIRMVEVGFSCILVGNMIGCFFFQFVKAAMDGRENCVDEPGAVYGDAPGACQFKDTWVAYLIHTDKLPPSGGTELSLYIRGLNWAVPTMVLYVVGDTYPVTVDETLFVFMAMLIGISANALIVGSIITLVAGMDVEQARITNQYEIFREFLETEKVPEDLIEKVSAYMRFMLTDTGLLLTDEARIREELPHTLKIAWNQHTRLKFFQYCPFFTFCTPEVLRNLSMVMTQAIFYEGDYIIRFGDLGQEMFFIESGTVEVIGKDNKTVFATLQPGGFFGETGLVFRAERMANIRAASICVCYVLTKDDLDAELCDCDFDVDATIKALVKLQESNTRRNNAISGHIANIISGKSAKLGKLLDYFDQSRQQDYDSWLRTVLFHKDGRFKIFLDFIGLFFLFYYMLVVPFHASFIFGRWIHYFKFLTYCSIVVDVSCVLEFYLRLNYFCDIMDPTSTKYPKDGILYTTLGDALWDAASFVPLELFMLIIPSLSETNYALLTCVHLIRMRNLFSRITLVEHHITALTGLTFRHQTKMVVFAICQYVFTNHWFGCIEFAIHRYAEAHDELTWLTHDGESTYNPISKRHDVCNTDLWSCYLTTIYMIGTLMTSVGYGDVSNYTDKEMIFQVILCISSAMLGANVCGQVSNYLSTQDKSGETAFKEKIRNVENYIEYRKLQPELRDSILTHYNTMWERGRSLGSSDSCFLHYLPVPLAAEVSLEMHAFAMKNIPWIHQPFVRKSLHGDIALAMKPQIILKGNHVYVENDNGKSVFFVLSGTIKVFRARDTTSLDSVGLMALTLLDQKHKVLGNRLVKGHHFGEHCLLSRAGLRADNTFAEDLTELYYWERPDIHKILHKTPFKERYKMILALFSASGETIFVPNVKPSPYVHKDQFDTSNVKAMFRMAVSAAEDVIDTMHCNEHGDDSSGSEDGRKKERTITIREQRRQGQLAGSSTTRTAGVPTDEGRGSSMRRGGNADPELSDESSTDSEAERGEENQQVGVSKWTEALRAYDRERSRRNSQRFNSVDLTVPVMSPGQFPAPQDEMVGQLDAIEEEGIGTLEERVRALFSYIDKDGSGKIDREELMLSMMELGLEKRWADVDGMISFADKDNNHEIDIDELIVAVLKELQPDGSPSSPPGSNKRKMEGTGSVHRKGGNRRSSFTDMAARRVDQDQERAKIDLLNANLRGTATIPPPATAVGSTEMAVPAAPGSDNDALSSNSK